MPLGYKLESEENFISTLYMRETKKEIVTITRKLMLIIKIILAMIQNLGKIKIK